MKKGTQIFAVLAIIGLLLTAGSAYAGGKYDPGATDTEIKIGDIHPLSGPASGYGEIGRGNKAYFDMVNDKGGINGRKVKYLLVDDAYSPPKTVEQARRLVEKEKVLLIFQSLGTPCNTAIYKYMNAKKVPQLFISSGASKWGKNPKKYPWTMGFEPTYHAEGIIYAEYILKNVPDPKIGILFQNDDYGRDYLDGLKEGLGDKAKKLIVAELSYEVADPTVDSQIVSLKNSGANVFYNVTTPKFAAMAIRQVYDIGWRPLHLLNHVSASVGTVLKPAGLEKSVGVITAAWLKDPTDPQWRNDDDYKFWSAWMDKYYPQGNKESSFNVASMVFSFPMHQVLKMCGDNLTRKNVIKQATSLKDLEVPMLLPGIKVNTSPTDYYPVESYQLARFDGTTFQLFGKVMGK